MFLHNRLGREQLVERLRSEPFARKTLSFYRYIPIQDPLLFRDELYRAFDALHCLGRIYVASEGINAQMSVPEPHIERFIALLETFHELKRMPLKWAIEDNGQSFLKLKIKARRKIVADGIPDGVIDLQNIGTHLSPADFHELSGREDVLVVDMRNRYESEVGRFENAICPDSNSFREEVEWVVQHLAQSKNKKILLYCTGGIRCEKASAWMRHHGFKDVNQLHGGIIAYAAEMRQLGIPSRFIGKNFVFDERLGERITPDIIGRCHQCGAACDTHYNCHWDPCHKLFIQCDACREAYKACCSQDCKDKLYA